MGKEMLGNGSLPEGCRRGAEVSGFTEKQALPHTTRT